MATEQDQKYREKASRGKYHRLYRHLCDLPAQPWRTNFTEVESILRFKLPASARRHRPWWANQTRGNGHSHALAWITAGWKTAKVDMVAETLVFRPSKRPGDVHPPSLDEVWPVRSVGTWPEGLSLTREDMYEERGFAGHSFEYVGPIRPERDERGEVARHFPQSRYVNERNLPLNKYGAGPFCRFRVAKGWRHGGVYVLAKGGDPLYIGECENLDRRWGPSQYGSISPRNCFKNGQETNCRINNLIYRATKTGAEFDLSFYPVEGDKDARQAVENELVTVLRPPWNR